MVADLISPLASGHRATAAVTELRRYLEDANFHGIYKNLVSVHHYFLNAAAVHRGSSFADDFPVLGRGELGAIGLLYPLVINRDIPRAELTERELRLAEQLVEAGLLRAEGDRFSANEWQLISAHGLYLLIDGRINFRRTGEIHRLYIGPDSYLLLYYLDEALLGRGKRVLDLCTGSGIVGLYAARFGANVVSTDVAPTPLLVASWNRILNGRQAQIEIREQELNRTLECDEPGYDLICCNPPFVSAPAGMECAIYAQGRDHDGEGYLRLLFTRGMNRLTEEGRLAIVADLVGDVTGPYFMTTLREIAQQVGFQVDAFVDNVVTGDANAESLSYFLKLHYPERSYSEINQQVREHYATVLRAERFFLTTMVARRADCGSLRVFNRFARDGIYGKFVV